MTDSDDPNDPDKGKFFDRQQQVVSEPDQPMIAPQDAPRAIIEVDSAKSTPNKHPVHGESVSLGTMVVNNVTHYVWSDGVYNAEAKKIGTFNLDGSIRYQ